MPRVLNGGTSTRRRSAAPLLAVVLSAVAGAAQSGCFESHEPVLLGERYTCECTYDRETFDCEWADIDGDDMVDTCLPTMGPTHEDLKQTIRPCSDVSLDPEEFCALACIEWGRYPADYVAGSGRHESGDLAEYEGGGACDPEDDPPREYIWPAVPAEAVRNGVLVPEESSVIVTIIGDGGGTTTIEPETGHISVSGGGCEVMGGAGSATCPNLVFHDFGFTLPTFMLGSSEVTDARLTSSGIDEELGSFQGAYSFEGFGADHDLWSYLTGAMPLEADGFIEGHLMDVTFEYRDEPPELPAGEDHEMPSNNAVNARQGPGWEKFIQFAGKVTKADIDGRDLEIDFDLWFDYFDGSPLVAMSADASPFDTSETILDGTATIDDLGGGPVRYEWFVTDHGSPEHQMVLAFGERASVPTAILHDLANPQAPYSDVCLRVFDSDDYYDEYCLEWPALPGPAPDIGCGDVGISWSSTYRFRRIVEAAGMMDWINSYEATDFTMIIPDNAFMDELEALYPGLEQALLDDPGYAQSFVLSFAAPELYWWYEIDPLTVFGLPAKAVDVNRSCTDPCVFQQSCGEPEPWRVMHIFGPDV